MYLRYPRHIHMANRYNMGDSVDLCSGGLAPGGQGISGGTPNFTRSYVGAIESHTRSLLTIMETLF